MVKFTVNLCVIDKAQYSEAQEEASYLPPKPTPKLPRRTGMVGAIGEVLLKRHDLWWSLREGTPLPLLPNKSFWLLRRMVAGHASADALAADRKRDELELDR